MRCRGSRRGWGRLHSTPRSRSCSPARASMNRAIEELVRSLLYEGYALYPYTPGVKNATPTPFGIVYTPAYAEAQPAAYSKLRMEAVMEGGPEAELSATIQFLQAAGEGHK